MHYFSESISEFLLDGFILVFLEVKLQNTGSELLQSIGSNPPNKKMGQMLEQTMFYW